MKRLHLFEIHDQDWCPRVIRDAETDYLQFVIAQTKPYAAMVPILSGALQRTGARHVLDLCSGAGGPWFWLRPVLAERGVNVSVVERGIPVSVLEKDSTSGRAELPFHPNVPGGAATPPYQK